MQESMFEIFERMIEYNFAGDDMGEVEWPFVDKNNKVINFKCKYNVLEYNSNGAITQNMIMYMDSDHDEENNCVIIPSNIY